MKSTLFLIGLAVILCVCITPTVDALRIHLVGDLSGIAVRDALKKRSQNYIIALGDLGYGSSLSWFKSNYVNVFGSKLKCLIGNHDSLEDGSSSIYTEAKNLCSELWNFKVSNGTTLIIGWNSNGNMNVQLGKAQGWVTNSTFMKGVKNVVILSHKPGATHPNAHHPVESSVKTFYYSLTAKVPQGIPVYWIAGHNHDMAKSASGKWYESGAGGKSHYSCGTSSTWPFCNNSKYGFLEINTYNNGTIGNINFFDTNLQVVK